MTRDARGDAGDRDDRPADASDANGDARNEAVDAAFEAGVALFNAGHVLAARDRWEAALNAVVDQDGSDVAAGGNDDATDAAAECEGEDERVLRGLLAVATAADRARGGERSDAAEHGTRAVTLLGGVGGGYRGLVLEPVREWCRELADALETPDAASTSPDEPGPEPPTLRIDGVAVGFEDLDLAATLAAAPALAAAVDAGDEETLSSAARLAREERGTGRTRVTELVFAYLRRPEARPQIAARIADHVDRDRRERRDVSGLFE
ncbi:DUF309 domain-containing protein [Halorubrum rubrum]|uniref:DUF309 domain-containing protein n=1 Tax=Halorubrum rubrum TaxID=1126240 RepID=A0ABD5QXX2_9EURY|nr:DUF309 domain-containing protein [Halorubrum rubrum]